MPLVRRPSRWVWSVALLFALGFVAWTNLVRNRAVERLTFSGATVPPIDPGSPTGYAGGVRMLMAPGHNNESYQWIVQTQVMIARDEWRLRHVDYDNAPAGRPAYSASVYRWWLAALAWCDHWWSDQPIGLSVERAARWADPLLLMLFLTGGTLLVAWRFGSAAASVFPLLGATLYPFGGAFLPGCPDDIGLGLILSASVTLTLLAGANPSGVSTTQRRGWFVASGLLGVLALWVNVPSTVPLLAGIGLGAIAGQMLSVRNPGPALPWRSWSTAGAIGTLLAWLVEYAPSHLELGAARLGEIHPLYALAWLGGGELLVQGTAWLRGETPWGRWRARIRGVVATMALAAPVGAMLLAKTPGFLTKDVFALRLTGLGDGTEFPNLWSWVIGTWEAWPLLALGLPLLMLSSAALLIGRAAPEQRMGLSLIGTPALIALGVGLFRLSWWNQLDALLLVLAAAVAAGVASLGWSPRKLAWYSLGVLAMMLPGLVLLMPTPARPEDPRTRPELEALAERDFAHWLARRTASAPAIVLAPPNLTVSLIFHGGLRGISSPYRENAEGFQGAVRLAGSTLTYEAQELAAQRKLTHIALPSWDGLLDRYAQLGADQPEHTLVALLHSWLPPRWLRPVPYYLPRRAGFAEDRLIVFEVTEVQDQATALSRLTEYFLDMGQVRLATKAAQVLASDYRTDLGALIATARTDAVRRDGPALGQSIEAILLGLREGEDDSLDWDRRVSLCLVLAHGGRTAEARLQAQRCLEEMTEDRLRELSEATLFQFLMRCRALGLEIEDAALRASAKSLLPALLRNQL